MCIFRYFSNEAELGQLDGETFYLPKEIDGKFDIFRTYGALLSAPNGYFGDNWDAFSDCLLDLDWINKKDIFIIHRDMPRLSLKDVQIYLEVLQHAMVTWADDETEVRSQLYPDFVPHHLTVFFPNKMESLITAYTKKANPLSPGL